MCVTVTVPWRKVKMVMRLRSWKKSLCVGILAMPYAILECPVADARQHGAIEPESRYVAMGSSFAAGPGVGGSADKPANRCSRSNDNYAHQLARERKLKLVDVSCGGATTEHILGPWDDIPAQIDAVTADTRLVTVTIGGNDVALVGGLYVASCRASAAKAQKPVRCPASPPPPAESAWALLESRMTAIAQAVRARVPRARLIFVDYITLLPRRGDCPNLPMSADDAQASREKALRLSMLTRKVARRTQVELFQASRLSERHDACAKVPWANGYVPFANDLKGAPFHPNMAGMTAIAAGLNKQLR